MNVYKFGGSSIASVSGIKNVTNIIKNAKQPIVVVFSAMGKITNSLERVVTNAVDGSMDAALLEWEGVKKFHDNIISELNISDDTDVRDAYRHVDNLINETCKDNYDKFYDSIVSFGEILSSLIVSLYMKDIGINNQWMDMRRILVTDGNFREANVNMVTSEKKLKDIISSSESGIYVLQGFIGGTSDGDITTLGREGSDYTAAVVANILDCTSVTIWKDVEGIYNADPRFFSNVKLIPNLSYLDAIELAYSGAQIIHPKTIKPLQNKQIDMYVKPFCDPSAEGTIITDKIPSAAYHAPVSIVKKSQILMSIYPKDYSFAIEDSIEKVFTLLNRYKQKINLIQTSAIKINVSVNESRNFEKCLNALSLDFKVLYNKDLELLTIRGYTPEVLEKESQDYNIYVKQQTRRTVKLLRNSK